MDNLYGTFRGGGDSSIHEQKRCRAVTVLRKGFSGNLNHNLFFMNLSRFADSGKPVMSSAIRSFTYGSNHPRGKPLVERKQKDREK
jgi:hypothetical protein